MSGANLATFASIRGHAALCAGLRLAAARERLAHGLLFAGPDGVGKQGVARALAAWMQCAESGPDDACGRCDACRQVTAGTHPDVVTVAVPSGKKEIGIDRVRDLKRFVFMQPVRGRAKVAIVDDAPALTVAAQNALLKTLEEPPRRSFVILVAANADALLPTVKSRCQRVRFGPLTTAEVVDVLTCDHGLAPEAAAPLARLAEGSPGRALLLQRTFGDVAWGLLDGALAGVEDARYCRLVSIARELNAPEAATALKLEIVLAELRDRATRALAADDPCARAGIRGTLERADAVQAAANSLRRGNPNRQLLLESLLLQFARR
ncbi:DNA polymerase III subunit delta' [Candidatus Binatia bacterium]|nr:DNA polymerase III subunit delta' [Candidatus Binatia bacterium]